MLLAENATENSAKRESVRENSLEKDIVREKREKSEMIGDGRCGWCGSEGKKRRMRGFYMHWLGGI